MRTAPQKPDTAGMTKAALCAALLCAASYLVVPLPFTPVVLSLHTVIIHITGLILRPRQAICAVAIYLLMGAIGLPVFAGGTAGLGKLLGPTGGFYFGFLLSVAAVSLLRGRQNSFCRYFLLTAAVGLPIQHLTAILFMCFYNRFHIPSAVLTASLPFLPGDLVKCAVAAMVSVPLNRALAPPKE